MAGGLLLIAVGLAAGDTDPDRLFPRDQGMTLPDGTVAGAWVRPEKYTRTYYVDQHNANASDEGDGSARHPFLTINRAAAVVQAGERVLVRAGIYREQVQPARGGDGPDRMITYEAEPGATVVIRGSCVLPTTWQRAAGSVWKLRLPQKDFAEHNPFAYDNIDEREIMPGDWNALRDGPKLAAYTLKRGLIFQKGQRLNQVARAEDLAAEGTYWVDEGGWVLHAHLFGGAEPNAVLMEATNRRQCFAPKQPVPFVRVKGFAIEQVGNAFSYPVAAAVSPTGGHHWILEDCVIRHVNADALNLGSYQWTWGGNRTSGEGWDCIVRRNTISDCGVSGIKALTPFNCVIEDNVLEHIGWQNVELGYDNGGMKLLVCRNLLVRHNLMRDITAAPGVWLDWDNVNCRVTQNVCLDIQNAGGAVFIEAAQQTNWVDHNVIWNVRGNGVYQHDTDELVVFNNLIGRCSDCAVRMQVCTTRQLNGRAVTSRRNQVRNNVTVDCAAIVFFGDPDNSSDWNLIGNAKDPQALATWQKASGKDAHSVQVAVKAAVDGLVLRMEWTMPEGFVAGPFGREVAGRKSFRLFEPGG